MQIAYEYLYVGPQLLGHTYLREPVGISSEAALIPPKGTHDPATLPSCERAFTSATATARLEGGRGNELLTHVYMTTKPAYC